MTLFDAIKARRSIRRFSDQPVDENSIRKILEAGIYAPSAGNLQPWKYYVVTNKAMLVKLSEAAYSQIAVTESAGCIVVCIDKIQASSRYGERGQGLYAIQDTAAAMQNMLLVIHELGLGACWIGAFTEAKVCKILNLSSQFRPVAILAFGHPTEVDAMPPRKPLESVVEWIR